MKCPKCKEEAGFESCCCGAEMPKRLLKVYYWIDCKGGAAFTFEVVGIEGDNFLFDDGHKAPIKNYHLSPESAWASEKLRREEEDKKGFGTE
jgi:hypothetical protein